MNPAKAREAVGRIKEDRETFMLALWAFLRPTKLKMLFLAEWIIYVLIELARGKLRTTHQLIVAGYPLIVFYLVGCTMVALAGAPRRPPRWRYLLGMAALLVVSEQVVKAAVGAFIPWKASVPIIPGWLHLAHVRNMRGSWLLAVLDIDWVSIGMLIAQCIIVLPCFVLGFLYYAARKRRSLWVDVALVSIVAGIGGALSDLSLRGYTLDFINLPGVTTADLKDVFVYVGVAALFAEFLENEVISLRWLGWRGELEHTRRLIGDFLAFSIEELREIFRGGCRQKKL